MNIESRIRKLEDRLPLPASVDGPPLIDPLEVYRRDPEYHEALCERAMREDSGLPPDPILDGWLERREAAYVAAGGVPTELEPRPWASSTDCEIVVSTVDGRGVF